MGVCVREVVVVVVVVMVVCVSCVCVCVCVCMCVFSKRLKTRNEVYGNVYIVI